MTLKSPPLLALALAASAFAASKLARDDATSLLMVGTGRLSRCLIEAHATTRSISSVRVWGRSPEKAATIAEWVRENVTDDAAPVSDLDKACNDADIISAATFATTPLIRGASLPTGVHVDLVGAVEGDVEAARLFETREGDAELAGELRGRLARRHAAYVQPAAHALAELDPQKALVDQISDIFARQNSPIWMDIS